MHHARCLLRLGFLQCLAGACAFRLMEEGIFAVGEKTTCDQFGRNLRETRDADDELIRETFLMA